MKSSTLILAIITFVFLFWSCERIEIGKPFDCKVGEKYRIDWNLSFSIDSVYDYRCPENMECFWSGDVDLFFKIKHNSDYIDTLIYLYQNRNGFVIAKYTWKVLEVIPLNDNSLPAQKDFTIKMMLLKN